MFLSHVARNLHVNVTCKVTRTTKSRYYVTSNKTYLNGGVL